jgi:outer membrane protein OmpA-like peptidoglycan-associated protein
MTLKTKRWLFFHLSHAFIFLMVALPGSVAMAQSIWHLGVRAGYDRVWHETVQDVRAMEGECGAFTTGRGHGVSAALVGEVDLLPWLRGTARLAYAPLGGRLSTYCDNGIIVPTGGDNEFEPLLREYTKDVRLDMALLELGAKFSPFDLPVFVSGAISVGLPLFAASWEQEERIVAPEGALFPGFVRSRSNGAGDFTDTQLRTAIVGGIGYAITLHEGVEFSPELLYSYPLSDATTGYDWKISSVSAGASLTWRFERSEETPPPAAPVPPPPPPVPEPPVARIGTTMDAEIDITETFVTETFPLLPYVFFEENSADLPRKYRTMNARNTAAFTESGLPRRTMAIYYHLLDIIGRRLRLHPDIRINLIGSTDDKDVERGNSGLALRRAETVRDYFTGVWNIDEDRISVSTQKLPQMPSSQVYAEGDEENRRVEIQSDSDEIFRPVVHENLSEYDISPPVMEIALGAESATTVARWSMTVTHGSDTVASFGTDGAPPASLRWQLDDLLAARVQGEDELTATLTVTDAQGLHAASSIEIPVHKKQNSYEVGRLSLIVFDFDRSDILPHNRRMIRRFVAQAIKPTSSVDITGSTDRLGEADHNQELSTARANNVKAILLEENPAYRHLSARGIGEAPDLYDNDLPEGRFYCRTVAVEVKTPIE